METVELVSALDLVDAVRPLTYRRLDYWVRTGLISAVWACREHTHDPGTPPPTGSGHARAFTPMEADVARHIAWLTDAGVELAVAARCARAMVEGGLWVVPLSDRYNLVRTMP